MRIQSILILTSLLAPLAACASDNQSRAATQDLEGKAKQISSGLGEHAPDSESGYTSEAGAPRSLSEAELAVKKNLEALGYLDEEFDEEIENEAEQIAESLNDDLDVQEARIVEAMPIVTSGPAVVGEVAPEFELTDQDGNALLLSDQRGKIVVLEWFNHGCPYVKKHYSEGHMQSLQQSATDQGVVWLSICSSAEGKQGFLTPEESRTTIADKGVHSTAVLSDAGGTVGKLYGARTTPHMFVIDANGMLVYAGAIDDDRNSTNPSTCAAARNYVMETVDALLAGQAVEPHETQPYGCGVKY